MNGKRLGRMAAALLPVLLLTGALILLEFPHDRAAGQAPTAAPREFRLTETWYNGVALPSLSALSGFTHATGVHPQIVSVYTAFGTPFPAGEIRRIVRSGALPLVQINFHGISLPDILAGRWDPYLRQYAAAVKDLRQRVALSYGHEPNGTWYPWGCHHVPPATYVAAWRYIHSKVSSPGVSWVWSVNTIFHNSCPIPAWYPGGQYVDWIGIDGYLRTPKATYGRVFDATVTQVRRFRKPVILTEAGVANGPESARRIRSLYDGAHRSRLLGIIYFNARTPIEDYRLQDDPSALLAVRQAAARP